MKKYVNKADKPTPAYSIFPLNLVFAVKLTESGSKGKIEAFTVK